MNDLTERLVNCFVTVFPGLSRQEILRARQDSVPAWDSMAALTLVSVLEEEFQREIDFELLPELNSFEKIRDYLGGVAIAS